MSDSEEEGRLVVDHLDKELTKDQRADIDKALLREVKEQKLDYTQLKNDEVLHALILTSLAKKLPEEWAGLKGHPDWKAGSPAYNQFNTALKNHVYRDGKWIHNQLNPKQPKTKETPDHDAPEDQPEAPKQENPVQMMTR